jgi:PadR family transcriptional regulator, phenolic acid-responsive transcriptional regulator
MSARHVLLGLFLDRPAYPYQLADRLKQRLGPSWQVDSGQLYKTVKLLERGGLIERVNKTPGGQDERHVFSITQRGIEEFERWFEETRDPVRLPRRPLLAKITFAGPDRLARGMTKLDDYELQCAGRLSETTGMRDALPSTEDELLRADHLLLRLNLSTDIYSLEGELRWAKEAREVLTWLSEQDRAVWPNGSGGQGRTLGASARAQLFTRIAGAAGDPEKQPDTARERSPAPKRLAG